MKLEERFQIEKCCSGDMTRNILMHVRIKADGQDGKERQGFMDATDGSMFARVPCIVEADDILGDGLIPANVLATARKNIWMVKGELQIKLAEKTFQINARECMIIYNRQNKDTYPNTDAIIPPADSCQRLEYFSFDPFRIERIANAIGCARKRCGLIMKAKSSLDPIMITDGTKSGAFAILMPMKAEGA